METGDGPPIILLWFNGKYRILVTWLIIFQEHKICLRSKII